MKKEFWIKGMHCVGCESRIQQALEKKEIVVKQLSHKNGKLIIDSEEKDGDEIQKIIEQLGYTLSKEKVISSQKNRWKILLILLGIGTILYIFKDIKITEYFLRNTTSVGFGFAIIMGLVASISTCLAIVGSVVLGFTQYIDQSKGRREHLKVQGLFHLGRIGGFFLLGGILGEIGKMITFTLGGKIVLTTIVGIVLIWMGLHLAGFLPSITKLGFYLPKRWTKKLSLGKSLLIAPIIGLLTFFLPCGFTQSMQIFAIQAGNFWDAGISMALFALGTLPVLLAVGLGGEYIKEHRFGLIKKIIGFLIIIFAAISISNIFSLRSGLQQAQTQEQNALYEEITIQHNGVGFDPETIVLQAGKNYKITILPSMNGLGCMNTLMIPKLSNEIHQIKTGEPIIYILTNAKAGTYEAVCGSMGMHQGSIIVE